jgi:glutathione S-transferase
MSLRLYTLSGSPFGWKVQLALEFKRLPYEVTYVSPDKGDLEAAWFRALNPHGKAPVLVDGDFTLFESDAIVDYLEDAFPAVGARLWPRDARRRALARRTAIEASAYLYPPIRTLVTAWSEPEANRAAIEEAKPKIKARLDASAGQLTEQFFTGAEAGAADFAVYPLVALVKRLDVRRPEEGVANLVPEPIYAWSREIEAVPGFASIYPPHWRN